MVMKRLTSKISDTSKALADAKPDVNVLDTRRKVLDKITSTGLDVGQKGSQVSSEVSAVAHTLEGVVNNVSYADLSTSLQTKFKMAGLGGERGSRTAAEAQSFYESSVPDQVKLLGPDKVKEWLAGKDASHKQSFENAPDLVKDNSNFVWESSSANRARGAEDMTGLENLQVNLNNGFDAFAISAKTIVPQATLYAAAIEGGISIIENSIYVYRGHKDVRTALQDTAKNTAKSAVVGLVVGTAIAGASAVGAAPVIAAAAPVLGVVGGAILVYSASKRIHTALTVPVYNEQGKVIDSYVVRYIDDLSDDELIVPLNNQLQLLNMLKAEVMASIPNGRYKQLSAAKGDAPIVDDGVIRQL